MGGDGGQVRTRGWGTVGFTPSVKCRGALCQAWFSARLHYSIMPFGCKCFVLKRGNLDKFESRSSDGILLGYTHGKSYRVFNL
jgi:hypothetical protein